MYDFSAFKEAEARQPHPKRGKMDSMNRSQVEMNGIKMLEKIKSAKSSKAMKDLISM